MVWWWCGERSLIVYLLHFTIRTGGRYFLFVSFVVDKRKRYFVRMLINFVGGCAFFTPVAKLIATYSIEIEYPSSFFWGVMLCAYYFVVGYHLFHGAHIIVDAPLKRFNEVIVYHWYVMSSNTIIVA